MTIRLSLVTFVSLGLVACSELRPSPAAPSQVDSGLEAPAARSLTSIRNAAPSPSRSTTTYEQKFMMNMIDHHQMAIEMAELCLAKAVHQELRDLCSSIIAVQSAEIRRMQRWLRDWYSVSYTPQMSKSGERDLRRLSMLSGADFEIAFMEMMIMHHEAAIEEAQQCSDRASHSQLLELCENIATSQSAEIQQMEEWLCAWYGRC